MTRLIGLALIAAPFVGFGLMMGQETHMGMAVVLIAALLATGSIILGTEILDNA